MCDKQPQGAPSGHWVLGKLGTFAPLLSMLGCLVEIECGGGTKEGGGESRRKEERGKESDEGRKGEQ